jgi:hypothetical protein
LSGIHSCTNPCSEQLYDLLTHPAGFFSGWIQNCSSLAHIFYPRRKFQRPCKCPDHDWDLLEHLIIRTNELNGKRLLRFCVDQNFRRRPTRPSLFSYLVEGEYRLSFCAMTSLITTGSASTPQTALNSKFLRYNQEMNCAYDYVLSGPKSLGRMPTNILKLTS